MFDLKGIHIMDIKDILMRCDHTLLKQESSWSDIKALCDEGLSFGVASVCIPPSYVSRAAEYLGGKLPVCTVIGFPNGYNTTQVKAFEAAESVKNGAAEIDMVVNIGMVKDGEWDEILSEIRAVKKACGSALLKVIIETCLLTDEEKIRLCEIVSKSGADFIKTSTGFSTGGATAHDVALLRKHSAQHVKVKAAGGISSIADAEEFVALGADRLGTSRIVKLAKAQEL